MADAGREQQFMNEIRRLLYVEKIDIVWGESDAASYAAGWISGFEAKRFNPSASERNCAVSCPRTLLPASSRGGEKVASPLSLVPP